MLKQNMYVYFPQQVDRCEDICKKKPTYRIWHTSFPYDDIIERVFPKFNYIFLISICTCQIHRKGANYFIANRTYSLISAFLDSFCHSFIYTG